MTMYSILSVIREMHIKTTLKYHCTLTRMAKTKGTENTLGWCGHSGTGHCIYYWWECKLLQPLGKLFIKSTKAKYTHADSDQAILLSIYMHTFIYEMHTYVHQRT